MRTFTYRSTFLYAEPAGGGKVVVTAESLDELLEPGGTLDAVGREDVGWILHAQPHRHVGLAHIAFIIRLVVLHFVVSFF